MLDLLHQYQQKQLAHQVDTTKPKPLLLSQSKKDLSQSPEPSTDSKRKSTPRK